MSHQKFGMTPFDQQNMHLQGQMPHVDQKIEERESLRHSTHRSQRSDRGAALVSQGQQLGANLTGQQNMQGANTTQTQMQQQMQNTNSERFGNTEYNLSENQERPSFQKNSNQIQHDQEQEARQYAQQENKGMFTFDKQNGGSMQGEQMGHLQQIVCGRDHQLNLTRDGDVYSFGSGTFSAAGHGGSKQVLTPMILKPMRDKRVMKIACGESHSLILTDRADVYAWGRGFEGQLGLSKSIEVASIPQYIQSFYGKPIAHIEAGAFFSLAITKDG